MIELRPLTGVSWETLAQAFNAAFSDYAVPMAMSAEALAAMQGRRGYAAEHSYGAFLGEALVGFALTGLAGGPVGGVGGVGGSGGEVAYNSGTGVVPAHRRGQLGKRLVEAVAAQVPAQRYLLEVIEDNGAAVALYRRLGFAEQRRLQCWTLAALDAPDAADAGSEAASAGDLAEQTLAHLEAALAERDIEPSWQNTLEAMRRAATPPVVLGDEHGAVAVFPSSGDLPLLCVRRSSRRQGHGRRLLAAAQARAGRGLRLLNVDASDEGIEAFLSAAGATRTVVQLEMERLLR